MPLQTVAPQRLYQQIAGQVRALIACGEFVESSRLPAERELALQLGVSRPSVREALIALEVEGWVEVRTGKGIFVRSRPPRQATGETASGEWGPLEVMQARRVLEGETAALAAQAAQPADLDAMARAIAAMESEIEQGRVPLTGDNAFHLAIARTSGNVVLAETVQTFWDARSKPLFRRLGAYFESPELGRHAIAEHERIVEAIHARDADAARAAMHAHLDQSLSRLSASWDRAQAS